MVVQLGQSFESYDISQFPFTSYAYPSKPKIDGVGSAKYCGKKIQSTSLVYRTEIKFS